MFTTHLNSLRLTVFFIVLLSSISIYDFYLLGNSSIVEEGAFIESISAFAFLAAGVTLLFQNFKKRGLERVNTLFFATTCFLFFIREVELEDIHAPALILFLSDGAGRSLLFTLAYVPLILLAVVRYKVVNVKALRGYLKSPVTKLVLISCVGILAGSVLEELHLQLYEELAEMNASLVLLMAAMIYRDETMYKG